jgi:hypothetical protein
MTVFILQFYITQVKLIIRYYYYYYQKKLHRRNSHPVNKEKLLFNQDKEKYVLLRAKKVGHQRHCLDF